MEKKAENGKKKQKKNRFTLSLLVYPCTLIAYLRIVLLVGAIIILMRETASLIPDSPARVLAIMLLALSSILDAVDGYLARRFGHVSVIGACLDQLIDLAIQTVLWLFSGFVFAIPLMLLEWLAGGLVLQKAVFCSSDWKSWTQFSGNRFAAYYFAGQQRNLLSFVANISHTAFPMALILGSGWIWLAYLSLPGLLIFMLATIYIAISLFPGRFGSCDQGGGMQ